MSPLRCAPVAPHAAWAHGQGARRGGSGHRSGYRCLLVSRGPCDGCLAEPNTETLLELKTSKDLFVSFIFVYVVVKCYNSVCLFT